MTFLGRTSLSLHPADALYIQKESLGAPFKVANLGAPVGTITDDHLTGITGTLGAVPGTTPVRSTVTLPGQPHPQRPEQRLGRRRRCPAPCSTRTSSTTTGSSTA